MQWKKTFTAFLAFGIMAGPALAACPIELAVYNAEKGDISLEFVPGEREAAVSNRFRMLYPGDLILEGAVFWSEPVERPIGMLMHQCPEGDVTGEEIFACTPWRGTIYGVQATGEIGLLPKQTEGAAPAKLILTDLEMALHHADRLGGAEAPQAPGDVFVLNGCQE